MDAAVLVEGEERVGMLVAEDITASIFEMSVFCWLVGTEKDRPPAVMTADIKGELFDAGG